MYAVIQGLQMIGTWQPNYKAAEDLAKDRAETSGLAVSILKEVAIVTLPKVDPVVNKCE